MKTIGFYLREARNETGLTQSQVAKKLRYSSPQFVSNWERGVCNPPLKHLRTLSNLYRINRKEMLEMLVADARKTFEKELR